MKFFSSIRIVNAYKNRHEPEAMHELADSYWRGLIILCALLIVGSLAFDYYEFMDVNSVLNAPVQQSAPASEHLPFDKNQLQGIIDGFSQRTTSYQLYSAQAPVVVDPSAAAAPAVTKTN